MLVFVKFMLFDGCPWKLQISRTGKMEKSSHEFIKLQTNTALRFEQAPVFYIKTTLLLGIRSSNSFCDGMVDCLLWGQWIFSDREIMMRSPIFIHSICVTNSPSLNFHHMKLVYFILSFHLSAVQLVIIRLYFSCCVLSFFSSLLFDVLLARNTFPFFFLKKRTHLRSC